MHAGSTSKGNALGVALRGSPFGSNVELVRALGIGGALLSRKRHDQVEEAQRRADQAAADVLTGVSGADGDLRTEVTYLFGSCGAPGGFAECVEVMAADLLGEVFDVQEGGWNDPEATLALPWEVVHGLMDTLLWRALETIKHGFEFSGDRELRGRVTHGQLPLGHLPTVAERTLVADALSLRMAGSIGAALRAGQAHFGFLGKACRCASSRSCGHAAVISIEEDDSTVGG